MVHPIIVGYPGEPGILNQLYVEPRFLSLGEIGAYQLACTHSRCSPSKGGNSLQGPSNSHNARFRMPYRLRPTQKWSTTVTHTGGNIEFLFLSFFLSFFPTLQCYASWTFNVIGLELHSTGYLHCNLILWVSLNAIGLEWHIYISLSIYVLQGLSHCTAGGIHLAVSEAGGSRSDCQPVKILVFASPVKI